MAIDYAERAAALDALEPVDGVQEIPSARYDDPRAAPLGYWRVPDDRYAGGRITLLQYGRNAHDREDRGAVMLRRYGTYKSNAPLGTWQPWKDPFYEIVRKNGLHEFDPAQVVELGWHRRPGRSAYLSHRWLWERRVQPLLDQGLDERAAVCQVFPQLAEHAFTDVRCELCPSRVFSALSPRRASELVRQHESILHKEEVRTREIRDSIATALRESGGSNAAVVQAIEALVEQLAKGQKAK